MRPCLRLDSGAEVRQVSAQVATAALGEGIVGSSTYRPEVVGLVGVVVPSI